MPSIGLSYIVQGLTRRLQWTSGTPAFHCTGKKIRNVPIEQTLNELNSMEVQELKEFRNIGLEKARRLFAYREEKGKILSIEELADINGFSQSAIASIRKEGLVKRRERQHKYILNDKVAQEIKDVAAIGIGRNAIYWCIISRKCEVKGWSRILLKQEKKYIPEYFVQQVKEAMSEIPDSDVRVIEAQTHKSSTKDPFLFPFILNKRLVEVVLHAVSKRRSISLNPNVVKSYFKLSKGFNHQYYGVPLIEDLLKETKGKRNKHSKEMEETIEQMDSQPEYTCMVESLMESQLENIPKELTGLKIDAALINYFQSQPQKEGLANVLLLACAFINIEILHR